MSSTLATGSPPIFSLNRDETQDRFGLNVTVPTNGATAVSQADPSSVPAAGFEVSVDVTPSSAAPNLYYGVGCLGNPLEGQQYLGLTDPAGDWLVEADDGIGTSPTILAHGTARTSGRDTALGMVCAPVTRGSDDEGLSFAVDGTVVTTLDHTSSLMASGSGFTLDVNDLTNKGGGTVRFHTLTVHPASTLG
jgi:hypothetical protein